MEVDSSTEASRSGPTGDGPPAMPGAALARAEARVEALEARLADQTRARSDLVHLVSHELRTPITVISGFGRLLKSESRGELNREQHRYVDECLAACRRLDRFVGDLLAASPESGSPLPIEIESGDLDGTIRSLLESLAPMLDEREQTIETRLGGIERWAFDVGRIEQVLTNLLSNAVRYGRDGGTIRICTEARTGDRDDAVVAVSVEDDGPGIPEADRERVFEPYVRGLESDRCQGLGIGLAICRRIVAAHGGSIRVEAAELGGARFVFTLPRRGDPGPGDRS